MHNGGQDSTRPFCITSPQKVYQQARQRAGITKRGGIHALRHAYATNLPLFETVCFMLKAAF
jgi:integrase/recombinase XerD